MKLTEKISHIKSQIKALFEMASMTIKLQDGTEITSNGIDLATGVELFTIDAEGQTVALADGDYTLEDGMIVTVAEGVITEMKEASEAEVITEAPATETAATAVAQSEEVMLDMLTRIGDLELAMTEVFDLLRQMNDTSTEMMSKVAKMSKEPGAKAILETKKEKFSATGNDAMASFQNYRKEKKEKGIKITMGSVTISATK